MKLALIPDRTVNGERVRQCVDCGEWKPLAAPHYRHLGERKRGGAWWDRACRPCKAARMRRYRREGCEATRRYVENGSRETWDFGPLLACIPLP